MRSLVLTIPLALIAAVPGHALDPHVEAVIKTVEAASGKIEMTEDGRSLKLVDLAVPGAGPHDHREGDPYDAAFFEHLGHIGTLESLNVISTKFNDEWMPSLAGLTNLKSLRFTNNGKLTDAGMAHLSGLKNLESFSYVGTRMTGRAYAGFEGFDKLVKVSHRGSSIDDEGLKELCDHLPKLESLSLAHAKFTDAGAVHLAKLTKLKGFEIGTSNATPAALANLQRLPLESLQLGEGFDKPESLPMISGIPSMKRLTLTNCQKISDDELRLLATMKQLESLELGSPLLPDERLTLLKDFAFLKELKLIDRKTGYPEATRSKIQALLPSVAVKFQ